MDVVNRLGDSWSIDPYRPSGCSLRSFCPSGLQLYAGNVNDVRTSWVNPKKNIRDITHKIQSFARSFRGRSTSKVQGSAKRARGRNKVQSSARSFRVHSSTRCSEARLLSFLR